MAKNQLHKLVGSAMLSAVAFVIMLFEFPLLPAASYLKMDFSDIPCLLAGLVFGPGYGVLTELFKNLLEMLIRGFGTQMGFGNLQNFIIGVAFVLPFSVICRRYQNGTVKKLIIASVASLAAMIVLGFASNYLMAPLFFTFFLNSPLTPAGALSAAIISIPFNAIKGVLLCVIIGALWKPLISSLQSKFSK